MPGVGVQIPPNLADWWGELVEAGATDLGGLSANGDHISPEHPFPSPHQVRKDLAPRGFALTERLCAYPQYLDPEWMEQGVLDVVKLKYWSFIPRQGSGRRGEAPPDGNVAPVAIEKGRDGRGAQPRGADRALRRDEARGDRGDALGRRRAARRARRGHRDLRRQPEHQLHQRLRRRLRLLRVRAGKALARRLHRHRGRLRRADRRGGRVRRDRDLHAGRYPPGVRARGLRPLASAGEGGGAADPHPRVLADGDPLHVRALGQEPRRGLRLPARVRPRLHPGHRRRGPPRRRPPAHLAEQAARCPLGRDHRGLPPRRPALDLDRHVRPHRGALRARDPHEGRSARSRSAPAGSPSSSPSASSRSTPCSAAPTASRRSAASRT